MKKTLIKKEVLKFAGLFLIVFLISFVVLDAIEIINSFSKIEIPIVELPNQGSKCISTERVDSIYIPKIEIEAPLVFPETSETSNLAKYLDQGVTHYPESVLPGEKGQAVLLGHSAPPGWPKIKYDWVFSKIDNLETGDDIYVFYQGCQYNHKVVNKYFLNKGQELPAYNSAQRKSVLILISCWPPGKDLRRIAVEAQLAD